MPEEKVSAEQCVTCGSKERDVRGALYGDYCDDAWHVPPAADAGPRQSVQVERSLLEGILNFMNRRFDGDRLLKHQAHFIGELHRVLDPPPVPQEAAPRECDCEECASRLATAPDWAMRVAVGDTFVAAVEDRLGMGHGAWDMISAEKICRAVIEQAAALIGQAGSERERVLQTAQRYIKSLQRLLDEDFTPQELSNEVLEAQKEWAEASRLLGGESK